MLLGIGSCVFWTTPPVHAHLGALPAGIQPFYSDSELVGAATNLGLVAIHEGVPTWYTQFRVHGDIYWYGYAGDERVVVGTSHGMVETVDWGCSWRAVESEVPAVPVPAMLFDSVGERPVIVGTAEEEGSNYLYEAEDGTSAWQRDDETEVSGAYVGLVRAVGSDAQAALSQGEAGSRIHWRSGPGEVWSSRLVTVAEPRVMLLAVSSDVSHVYLAAFEGEVIETPSEVSEDAAPTLSYDGTSRVYRLATGQGDDMVVHTMSDALIDSGVMDSAGGLWMTDSADDLHHVVATAQSSMEPEIGHCIRNPGGQGLVACGQRPQEYSFFTQLADGSWEGFLLFDSIIGELCPDKEPEEPGDESTDEPTDETEASDTSGDDTDGTSESSDDGVSIGKDDMLGEEDEGTTEGSDTNLPDADITAETSGCQQTAGVSVLVLMLSMISRLRRRRY